MRTLSLLLALGLVPAAHAQTLLHELASPNEDALGEFGIAVSEVPDVDGDGLSDLLVGAEGEDVDGWSAAGRAYVYSGATGALLHALVSPNAQSFGSFGSSVSGVEDADGDGRGDLLIGAYGEGSDVCAGSCGRAYLFSGATGALLYALQTLIPEGGFGASVSGAPDVDGDGRGDLVVGAPGEDTRSVPETGRAYVYSGATGALIHKLTSPNEERRGYFGEAVSGAADLDGDGRGDVVVGAYGEGDGGSQTGNPGRAYVFSGASGEPLHELASPSEEEVGSFGNAVSGVADVDGDGRTDLLVGASTEHAGGVSASGRAYVLSGATGALLYELESPEPEEFGDFGVSVSGVPDVDGDGRADFLIGASGEDGTPDVLNYGRVYVYSGASGALLYALTSPNREEDGFFGESASGVGDVDGDGRGEVLVGAYGDGDFDPFDFTGRAYVFSGAHGGALAVDAEPVSPPIVIPATGGTFTYTVTTTNSTAATQTFQLWTRVTKPNGQQTPALRGPITRTLAPGASLTDELTQSIPGGIRAGTYTYTAYVGTYPSEVLASGAFTFTKEAAAGAGREGDDALWPEAVELPVQASAEGNALASLALEEARPNPFAGRTVLAFELPKTAAVRLSVYDVLGREIARLVEGEVAAGRHEVIFEATRLPAGAYLARLEAGGAVTTRRITLVR